MIYLIHSQNLPIWHFKVCAYAQHKLADNTSVHYNWYKGKREIKNKTTGKTVFIPYIKEIITLYKNPEKAVKFLQRALSNDMIC